MITTWQSIYKQPKSFFSQFELIIGDEAQVTGQIEADVVVISGHFSGDIYSTQRVEIQAPAVVRGTVQTAILQIEEGAVFDGKTKMLGPLPGLTRQTKTN